MLSLMAYMAPANNGCADAMVTDSRASAGSDAAAPALWAAAAQAPAAPQAAPQKQALPEILYPAPLVVRNTFLDTGASVPTSLLPFYTQRNTKSCPTSMLSDVEDAEGGGLEGGKLCDSLDGESPGLSTCPGTSSPVDGELSPNGSEEEAAIDFDAVTSELLAYAQSTPEVVGLTALSHVDFPLPVILEHALRDLEMAPSPAVAADWAPPPPPAAWAPCGGAAVVAAAAPSIPPPPLEPPVLEMAGAPAPPLTPQWHVDDGAQRRGDPAPLPADSPLSIGSGAHGAGNCRPCAHFHTKGCRNGSACEFCHLCGPGELKRRQRDRRNQWRHGMWSHEK